MMFNAKEHTLKMDHIEIDYLTFGKGDKPLVMIQGLNTNSIKGMAIPLAYMYRIFVKDYKVYLFDRRKDLSENVTVRDLAKDLAFAMDTLNIKNADLFGVSQGGMIAQYLAIERPDLVHKLVLAHTLSRNDKNVEKVIHSWIEMIKQNDMKKLVKDMAVKMYSEAYVKRYQFFMPLLTLLQKPKDIQRFITLSKACLTCDTYEDLDKIQCPTLVIAGKQDKIVRAELSLEIADKLNCQSYVYENLGHAAYEEAKDYNQRVYDFLKEE